MTTDPPEVPSSFVEQLEQQTENLGSFMKKEATGLLQFEGIDDLVQFTKLRAIESHHRFVDHGEGSFRAWLMTLARRTVADRHDHWQALKRNCGSLLSISFGQSSAGDGRMPATLSAGPATWASRREMLVIAMKALSILPEKDRSLLLSMISGSDLTKVQEQLGLSSEALRKAAKRAEERLRKTFQILLQK